jgi:hypothetical protein
MAEQNVLANRIHIARANLHISLSEMSDVLIAEISNKGMRNLFTLGGENRKYSGMRIDIEKKIFDAYIAAAKKFRESGTWDAPFEHIGLLEQQSYSSEQAYEQVEQIVKVYINYYNTLGVEL